MKKYLYQIKKKKNKNMEENQSVNVEKPVAKKDSNMAIKITLVVVIAAFATVALVYLLPRWF